jgi:hypothetical protein
MRARKGKGERTPCMGCTQDSTGLILACMLAKNDALSVMKLSMVNREFRQQIMSNWEIWIGLYRRWTRTYFKYSTMMTLPNFQRRVQPLWCASLPPPPPPPRPHSRAWQAAA